MTSAARFLSLRRRILALAALLSAALALSAGEPADAAGLWASYVANPDAHPHIPNCSYAGYHRGEGALPTPAVAADVRALGAKGDGTSDDTAAFAAAIAQAATKAPAAVLVPEGTYRLDGMIRLDRDGVVLRGAGAGKTILRFHRPLDAVVARMPAGSSSQWGWCGGLVWIGPADTFANGAIAGDKGTENWEVWRPGGRLAAVTAAAKRGERVLRVAATEATRLKAGDTVLLSWANPPDHSLLHAMAGHPLMKDYPWDTKGTALVKRPAWLWPVEIAAVTGDQVTLAQPLRLDIRPEWSVAMLSVGSHVREIGVEALTIAMVGRKPVPHLKDPGYNGVYLNRALHCWVKDVVIQDSDNGLIHASAKNTTISGLTVRGSDHHHATALRAGSHDNLISDFAIESKPRHGINTENLSTGNVWRRGRMAHGTFDSHRAMSFELIRSDITLNNDGGPGGADTAGPFLGARCVHWNVRVTGKSDFVFQSDCISQGALVGIQGVPRSAAPAWAMVTGDKGCLVLDEGKVPAPPDLYQAQLELRLKAVGGR